MIEQLIMALGGGCISDMTHDMFKALVRKEFSACDGSSKGFHRFGDSLKYTQDSQQLYIHDLLQRIACKINKGEMLTVVQTKPSIHFTSKVLSQKTQPGYT